VLYAGRLAPIKRIDLFLETVRRVKELLPHISAIVVGDGPLRQSLQQMAHKLGIERNVVFVGHQEGIEGWLRRARVFVLTSESEGLALSLMEAMRCGLPAVVPGVGELPELVDDGLNGYLVGEHSPEAFATCILKLLGDRDRLAAFGAAARRSAERFEVQRATALWDDVLAEISCDAGDRPHDRDGV